MRGAGLLFVLLVACLAAATAATVYAKKQAIECDSKGTSCKASLGKAGKVQLPALVAIKSAHGHYLSVSPPDGGLVSLSSHPKLWEEWTMEKVGDKIAFKSHHATFLSQAFHPADGYVMAAERLGHELFEVTEQKDGKIQIAGHNGMYLSAEADKGVRQEFSPSDWESWTVEHLKDGKVALRSAHGTYLAASNPHTVGTVSQQPTLNTWETFVIDHVDKDKLTVETSHDTFLAAHADPWHEDKVIPMERASMWELWTPFVNHTTGGVCLQAHDGRFLQAFEDVFEGWSLTEHCMEHELVEVVLVDEKMLAAAAKEAAAARKAAEAAARA